MSRYNYGDEDQNELMSLIDSYREPDDGIIQSDDQDPFDGIEQSNDQDQGSVKNYKIQVVMKDRDHTLTNYAEEPF